MTLPTASPDQTAEESAGLRKALNIIQFFTSTPKEEALDLSGLGLSSLPESLFEKLSTSSSRVTRINLAHNSLTTLPAWLAHLPNLRILFLLGNDFISLPPILASLEALRMLSFKHCKLEGELDAAKLPPNLVWLILTDNRITLLSDDFGDRCSRVRKLLLANNLLTCLPASFQKLTELELLRLANNPLPAVPKVLSEMDALTWVALGGSPASGGAITSVDSLPEGLRFNLSDFPPVAGAGLLGGGASGAVTRCRGHTGGPDVAIKKFASLLTSDGCALDEVAVLLEARDLPHVVRAVGFAHERDSLWVATELVPGAVVLAGPPSFDSVTRDAYGTGPIAGPAACAALLAAAGAAAVLHEAGIVHGDIYAHNTIAVEDGSDARLCDFGAAFKPPKELLKEFCQVEVRALGILCSELVERVPQELQATVRSVAQRCMVGRRERPSAQEVFEALSPLKQALPGQGSGR